MSVPQGTNVVVLEVLRQYNKNQLESTKASLHPNAVWVRSLQ
jgi:hypothetical protein